MVTLAFTSSSAAETFLKYSSTEAIGPVEIAPMDIAISLRMVVRQTVSSKTQLLHLTCSLQEPTSQPTWFDSEIVSFQN